MITGLKDSVTGMVKRKVSNLGYSATIGAGHVAGRIARVAGVGNALKIASHGVVQGVNRGDQLAMMKAKHMRHAGGHAKPKVNRMMLSQ